MSEQYRDDRDPERSQSASTSFGSFGGTVRGTGQRRIVALVLSGIAILTLGYAALSKRWLYNPRTMDLSLELGFGLRGNFQCEHEEPPRCRDLTNGELVAEWRAEVERVRERMRDDPNNPTGAMIAEQLRTSGGFAPAGWIAFAACGITILSLLVSAALVAARKRPHLPISPTTTALLGTIAALVAGCVFIALKPGPVGLVGINFGFYAFALGVLAAMAAALMSNQLLRPPDVDLLDDAMNPDDFSE